MVCPKNSVAFPDFPHFTRGAYTEKFRTFLRNFRTFSLIPDRPQKFTPISGFFGSIGTLNHRISNEAIDSHATRTTEAGNGAGKRHGKPRAGDGEPEPGKSGAHLNRVNKFRISSGRATSMARHRTTAFAPPSRSIVTVTENPS